MTTKFRPAYILSRPHSVDLWGGTVTGDQLARGGVKAILAVPWVESITHEPIPAVAFTVTQKRIVVEGHEDGVRVQDITLNGRVQWPTLRSMGAKDGDPALPDHAHGVRQRLGHPQRVLADGAGAAQNDD